MALDFPANPTEGQTYTAEGMTFKFTNGRWTMTTGAGDALPADALGYLFNNGTGTLSWTSTIGGYLPLTGGTLTGPLTVTAAGSSTTINSNDVVFSRTTGAAYIRTAYPTGASLIFTQNGVEAGRLDDATTTTPSHTKTLLRREHGDSRYLQLSGGVLTGSLTLPEGSSATDPRLEFGTTNTGMLSPIGGAEVHFSVLGTHAARIEAAGTTASDNSTLMTRQKADARYGETATANSWTGTQTVTGDVDASGVVIADELGGKGGSGTLVYGGDARTSPNAPHKADLTGEKVYVVAENGLEVVASTDNWATAATKRVLLAHNANGDSSFPGAIAVTGAATLGSLTTGATAMNGALDLNGELNINRAVPLIDFVETDAPAAYAMTRLVRDGNSFYIQTKSDTGAALSTDYRIELDSAGANIHRWYTAGTEEMKLEDGGLTVTNAISTTAGNISAGAGHLYANNNTTPQVGLRNAAGQTGALLYTDLATQGYWRQYESAASSNYTAYVFRYNGATGNSDVLRKADGDALYMRGPDITNTGRWTAQAFEINHTAPYLNYVETDEATNIGKWAAGVGGGNFAITPRDSSGNLISGGGGSLTLYRTANGISDARVQFGSDGSASGLPSVDSIVTRAAGDARYLSSGSAQNAVGSTIFGRNGGSTVGPGTNVSGADLAYQNMDNSYTGTLSGTWKTCGNTTTATSQDRSTCFRRTA